MRLAPLALAALVLVLAACTGGEPPPALTAATPEATPRATATAEATATATPEAASTPAPTAEASPTPEATATPTPRRGLEWIEPAPGVFEHRTFGDGEAIDWTHGIFVLDVETGLTEGYAVAGLKSNDHWYSGERLDGWIETRHGSWSSEGGRLLLHRETGRSWGWPLTALSLKAASDEHLLFEELDDGESTGSFILADSGLDEVARFSVDARDIHAHALFSPDGLAVALVVADTVYVVPVESGRPSVLLTAQPYDGRVEPWLRRWDTTGLRVRVWYGGGENDRAEEHHFRWGGGARLHSHTPCPGTLSPDGRFAAVLDGHPYYGQHAGYYYLDRPWPSVVITDAETCAPIFRVRSAHVAVIFWSAEWLPASDGFVVGVKSGYAIARVSPEPDLTPLPLPSGAAINWGPGPDPAPTGGERYFAYGSRVYDAAEDRWRGPSDVGWGPFWWGDSHRERWFSMGYWGEGYANWLLRPPKIEYPPFAEETAFRVAGTGSCLRLREEPDDESRVLDCLPDGERLLFVERDAEEEREMDGVLDSPHPSVSEEFEEVSAEEWRQWLWVYVRAEDGAEGWVSHDYLEHD